MLTVHQGLARQFSLGLTGVQIDAIYHTSVVLGGVEYFFGQGIHRKIPGSTHHGSPIRILRLGKTELPIDVIQEYIDSLGAIYTTESYDLFLHNCNNFSQDLSMFLVGKDIPEEIRTLPQKFLETPIGQMLRSQIDQSMRSMTQAPDAPRPHSTARTTQMNGSATNGNLSTKRPPKSTTFINAQTAESLPGTVHNVVQSRHLDELLADAKHSCAVIFFTSATCPPCKIFYPAYDELAAEAGEKAILIKVDLSKAYDIGSKFNVRVTPTFVTFLKGQKENEWSGASEGTLRGNVRLLVQMAWPQHRHTQLRLPTLQRLISEPVLYKKVPPIEKLVAKIGSVATDASFTSLINYVKVRESSGLVEAPLPDLHAFSDRVVRSIGALPLEVHFAVIDLVRIAAADSRVSSFLTTEKDYRTLLTLLPLEKDYTTAAYNLQAVSLQLACNLFGSPVFQRQIADSPTSDQLRSSMENLASSCLLASHSNARFLASALVYNLAAYDHNERLGGRADKLDVSSMGDLEAALVQAVVDEGQSKETLHGLLLALGLLLYCAPAEGSIRDLCTAMEVKTALGEKSKQPVFANEPLLKELRELL